MKNQLLYFPQRSLPGSLEADELPPSATIERLRNGSCRTDRAFDQLLPHDLRVRSSLHFTPLHVARRAAQWIDEFGLRSVVDIGSGAGKFCIAAALASKAHYLGIEQRARLVTVASELAQTLGVESRVTFFHGTLNELPRADVYYMYNPFGENLFGADGQIDGTVELSEDRYRKEIAHTQELLGAAPLGTYLLTYNGFGGEVPTSYESVRVDRELPNVLRLWRKSAQPGTRRLHADEEQPASA